MIGCSMVKIEHNSCAVIALFKTYGKAFGCNYFWYRIRPLENGGGMIVVSPLSYIASRIIGMFSETFRRKMVVKAVVKACKCHYVEVRDISLKKGLTAEELAVIGDLHDVQ